jgi:hypothetical protein
MDHGSEGYDEHAGLAIVYCRFAYSPGITATATTTLRELRLRSTPWLMGTEERLST